MNQKNETALAQVEPTGLAETATAQAQAMARADVEAKHLVARRFPRDMDQVREELLRDCRRPAFAREARFHMPIGDGVEGWTIRFVEAALAHMGNCDSVASTIFSDDEKEILSVRVTDYQRNISHASTATVLKTVERKRLRKGQKPITSRRNSYGDIVHVVPASETDFRAKKGAEVSKHVRTNGERLLPAWLKEEALAMVQKTQADEDAKDPDGARRQLADAFADMGVKVTDLKAYLGHDLDQATPADMRHLRAVYATIRDGAFTWKECMAARTGEAPDDGSPDPHGKLKKTLADRLKGQSKGGRKKTGKASASKPSSQPDQAKTSEPSSSASPTGGDDSAGSADGDASPEPTDEDLKAQGWEVDEETGELIPPPGWEG